MVADGSRDERIIARFERASLAGGLAFAAMAGACMLHWAVAL